MTHLNTEHTSDGQRLTFPSGADAGMIIYLPGYNLFCHEQPSGPRSQSRLTSEAAQFDALAWAADETERKRRAG